MTAGFLPIPELRLSRTLGLIQHLSDRFCQIRLYNRLVYKCFNANFSRRFLGDSIAVTRAEDNRDIGPRFHQLYRQLITSHVRHRHIRHNQIEIIWVRLEQFQCIDAARPRLNCIPQVFEVPTAHFYNGRFVVDNQNPFRALRQCFGW